MNKYFKNLSVLIYNVMGRGGYNPHKQKLFENLIISRMEMSHEIKKFGNHWDKQIVVHLLMEYYWKIKRTIYMYNNISKSQEDYLAKDTRPKRIHIVWFHLYEVLQWAELIDGDLSTDGGGLWGAVSREGIDWTGTQRNFLTWWKCFFIDLDMPV